MSYEMFTIFFPPVIFTGIQTDEWSDSTSSEKSCSVNFSSIYVVKVCLFSERSLVSVNIPFELYAD